MDLANHKWEFAGIVLLAATAMTELVAGPCYTVGNVHFPCTACPDGAIGTPGPCPTGLMLPDQLQTCGFYTTAVAVPLGTSGNQPSGSMSQGNGAWVCRTVVHCTKEIGTVGPIFPPVAQVYCALGTPTSCGTTTAFGPTGPQCPAE